MDQDSKASPDMVKKMFNVYNSINREERKDILSIFLTLLMKGYNLLKKIQI